MNKKQNLIFLIFFALLTLAPVPVFCLFRERIPQKNTENKTESSFPELTLSNYSTFPKRFEAWLSDSLPFKTQFIELYRGTQLLSGVDYSRSQVFRGKGEKLFYRATVENYKGIQRFSEDELTAIRDNLTNFFAMMEGKGAECLLYIAPDKEQIYSTQMPDSIRRISPESRADQTLAYLREQIDYPLLYPKQQLIQLAESHPVYFNTDTHWNELGGYFAARQIREAFTGENTGVSNPVYHSVPEKGKDLALMLGMEDRITETNAVEIDFIDNVKTHKVQTLEHGTVQRFTSNAPRHKKLMIIGDSFSEYMLRSAIHDVDEVLFVTYGQLSLIDLEAETPDYLVVLLVERNLPFLLNGFY